MTVASEKSIFFQALDIESSIERAAYVQQACAGSENLLTAVRALLRENERDVNPVDRPLVAALLPTVSQASDDEDTDSRFIPGTMIGPYKLMERIGEGGFGWVFVAEQQSPVRRRVALKIIKPGMESREVVARFEAERQAIALMDHPNIARVFDASVTETAQPYFVMELVRGIPLAEFCDSHQLDMSERLELFVTICHAVQHAHQKGIIHRDLKPSNILVTLQDGHPLAKVIDFGVAKAIGQSLTVKTIYTRFTSMVGTPAYMSPEQAAMSTGDVDTELEKFNDRLNSTTVLLASGRANADAQRWPAAYEAYTEATNVLPRYFLVWLERGGLNAKLGRWDAAATDFAKAVEIGFPIEQAELSGVPQLLFYAGKSAAYTTLSEDLKTSDKNDSMAVAARGQLAGELSPPDAARLADRVELMLAAMSDVDHPEATHELKTKHHSYAKMFYGVNLYVAGWAHLKAGNNERALVRLKESSGANWFGRGIAHPLIAIAHHRMGNAEDAVQSFEQSQAFLDGILDESVEQSKGSPSIPWIDWVEFLINHREASIVVKGYTPAVDPRFQQMQGFAEAAIAD